LLDTPGHVDFSTEMERTLNVLDYAILLISGSDGIQGHTKTLWRLLSVYRIPVFIFINKMDQDKANKEKIMNELKNQFGEGCIDFTEGTNENFNDQLAMCDEAIMESLLNTGDIKIGLIKNAIRKRKVFPCFFGSALKLAGIEQFMHGIVKYAVPPSYPAEFGSKIFKITRDENGNRLTHMKITGGKLKVKNVLTNGIWEEKVNQIRVYSGQKFTAVSEAEAGSVCAVTGLTKTRPGAGLGIEKDSDEPVLEPVLYYRIILPEDCDPRAFIPMLRELEEEEPALHIDWNEQLQEIHAQVMGEVQIEILQSLIKDRFGFEVTFGEGRILYKETIANAVEGVGHFEPLGHYAEVHLLLEPAEPGSGLQFGTDCSEDMLDKRWQRLVLAYLQEKEHKGVLTGSSLTDMRITLIGGKAHKKHTNSVDFREAAYRAVRQGLKETESILLEPYYSFHLEIPKKTVGRAISDIEKMHGTCEISQTNNETAVLTGSAPVSSMRNYQKEVIAYTKGLGRLFCTIKGYEPCHNTEEVIEKIGYDSERDPENPASSIFFARGTSFFVDWYEVKNHMHVPSCLQKNGNQLEAAVQKRASSTKERAISLEEIERIFQQTFFANLGKKSAWKKRRTLRNNDYHSMPYVGKPKVIKEEYLLVDGYNIIHAWPELKELADEDMESARIKLLDILSNYQGIRKCRIMIVFDAYRVQRHTEEILDYHNVRVVYTREVQTADQYIEKFAHDNHEKYDITVATSDALQQIIIRGAGCSLLSARELKAEIEQACLVLKQEYENMQGKNSNHLIDKLSYTEKQTIKNLMKEEDNTL
ncbi:MAG TPA: translation factor GTPase family protein, partial [Clostridia bacterium]